MIDAGLLGTERHIVGDAEGYVWSESVPRDAWHLTGHIKTSPTARCLDTLLRLHGIEVPSPPERFVTAMRHLVTGSITVPWRHVLPGDAYRQFFKNIVEVTKDVFPELSFDYYEGAWSAGGRVLSSLRPAAVDVKRLETHLAEGGASAPVLEGFRPKRSGFAHPVVYDRFGTRTGRLTVAEGPNFLVLKKTFRDVLRSSFEGGAVVSLDFRALEARIVLGEAGRSSTADDIYEDAAASLFGGAFTRDAVKVAVLAELYGASRSLLRTRLVGVTDAQLDGFVSTIRTHFGVENLRARLKAELASSGRIRNRFGRPLDVPPGQDNLLINTYAQSSGVDVSMLGFDEVIRRLGSEGVRPLFVLHDAVILDVSPARLADVEAISSVAVPTYGTVFPLKFEKIS